MLLSCLIFLLISLCFEGSTAAELISVLATSSRKGGLMHFAGFIGSLIKNPAAKQLDVHLLVDEIHRGVIANCHTLHLSFHNLTLYDLEKLDETIEGQRLRNETGDLRRFDSAIYKLDLINIIPASADIHRLLVLDIDVLVLEDITNLWKEADKNPGKYLYMAAEGYSSEGYYVKTSTKKHYPPPYGLSTAVMIVNMDELRRNNLTGKVAWLIVKVMQLGDGY
jgi:lipopolysaccharide biosynthesis glycosyltransferase